MPRARRSTSRSSTACCGGRSSICRRLDRLSAIRCWTGHRAATPDKLPLIGPSLESDRVWLATGHEGLGITTSLATGRLLADLLLKRPSEIPSEPYLPARLAKGGAQHD